MLKHTIKVEGLHCEKCEAKVNEAIKGLLKVKSVTSSHVSGETVVVAKDDVDVLEIKKIIVSLGHRITDTITEEMVEEKKGILSFFKKK